MAVRYPVLPLGQRPHQHNAEHQAWVGNQWSKLNIPVPLVIKASNEHDFLIEEAIEGKELGNDQILKFYSFVSSIPCRSSQWTLAKGR